MECNIITIRFFLQNIYQNHFHLLFNFFLNILFQFFLLYKPKITTNKIQLSICYIIIAFSLIILPISVYLLSNFEKLNIIITSIMILIQGLLNAISQSCMFGLVSFFPFEMIVSLSFGQALAGILLILLHLLLKFVW